MPIARRREITALSQPLIKGMTDPQHGPIDARNLAVVVAHPDDETIGCGALLGRLKGATVILVTDGAPRNLADARRYGFATAADYAGARLAEMHAALGIAGVRDGALITLGVPDQEAALNLTMLTRRVAEICKARGLTVLLTHAYEGGHPDHDATAFAAHGAARLLGDTQPILIVEMSFYRLGASEAVYQQFHADRTRIQISIPLDGGEKTRKRLMIAAHDTQKAILGPFSTDLERFRPAPAYDFSILPNDGRLLYESYDWGFDGARWRDLACSALSELGLKEPA